MIWETLSDKQQAGRCRVTIRSYVLLRVSSFLHRTFMVDVHCITVPFPPQGMTPLRCLMPWYMSHAVILTDSLLLAQ